MITPGRTAEVLAEILRELDQPRGPTECHRVSVVRSWTSDNDIYVVYTAPWFTGPIGYRQHLEDDENPYLAQDIAHFDIAEPLGRLVEVMGPPDEHGITWWDDATMQRLSPPKKTPRLRWSRSGRR